MTTSDDVKRFLMAISDPAGSQFLRSGKKRAVPFVTISRQTGAGGHTLAETLLKVMEREAETGLFRGWQICDQQLCEKLCQDAHLTVSMQSLLSEEYRSQIEQFIFGLFGTQTDQYLVIKKLFETIRAMAVLGKVIIVGRGGSQVTKGLDQGVHVRLAAPEPIRVRRMQKLLGQSEEAARQTVHKQDRDRARLVKTYFHADIDDPLLYDVTWNTGAASFEAIAEAIVSVIKHRAKEASSAV